MNNDFLESFAPEELTEFIPPERLTPSEFCDKYRVLEASTSAEPGPWRTDRVPYLRGIMDAFADPEVEAVVFQSATQLGKTECLLSLLFFTVAQRPGPTLFVMPTLDTSEDFSRTRLQPMFKNHEATKRKILGDRHLFTTSRMQFAGMDLFLAGANSAASLASKPCEFVLLDEVGKYPALIGEEADPISLALERQKTFPFSRKAFIVSTPTTQHGRITKELEDCDVIHEFYVPCPHCGAFQTLRMPQIKWPAEATRENKNRLRIVESGAWYECEHCQARLTDADKSRMVQRGEWRAKEPGLRRRKIGFQLSSIYSPWVKIGRMAVEFLKSKDNPAKLMNFVNSWLGEPFIQKTSKLADSSIMELRDGRARGVVPAEALALTAGVDVQQRGLFYVIRAWGKGGASWLVTEGYVDSFDSLGEVLFRSRFPVAGEEDTQAAVRLACVDAGFRTDEVYEFAKRSGGAVRAVKGSTHAMKAPFAPSRIEYNSAGKTLAGGLNLWLLDTGFFKDMLLRRVQAGVESPNAWRVHEGVTEDYARQICAEHKVIVVNKKTGVASEEWAKVSSHAQNHYFDCEVYALAGAEMLGARYWGAQKEAKNTQKQAEKSKNVQNQDRKGRWS